MTPPLPSLPSHPLSGGGAGQTSKVSHASKKTWACVLSINGRLFFLTVRFAFLCLRSRPSSCESFTRCCVSRAVGRRHSHVDATREAKRVCRWCGGGDAPAAGFWKIKRKVDALRAKMSRKIGENITFRRQFSTTASTHATRNTHLAASCESFSSHKTTTPRAREVVNMTTRTTAMLKGLPGCVFAALLLACCRPTDAYSSLAGSCEHAGVIHGVAFVWISFVWISVAPKKKNKNE